MPPPEEHMSPEVESLIRVAGLARESAYAPYSNFKVGAAVLARDGRVFTGCNVENASYGLSNCAERTALFAAIAANCRPGDFSHIAVVADTDGPVAPCGACRQVMLEIAGAAAIVVQANLRGAIACTTVARLLPGAFTLEA